MLRNEINTALRQYAKEKLSPTQAERELVGKLYKAFDKILRGQCFMVGSLPRFTAVRPIHDLDILLCLPVTPHEKRNPEQVLATLKKNIDDHFENPTPYKLSITLQTHSVTVSFLQGADEVMAVDAVPAYASGDNNEFNQDIYDVPEVLRVKHAKRRALYEERTRQRKQMQWIRSDPRGYIGVAAQVNAQNQDFRKAVKLVKKWKHSCADLNGNFKLKSFHVEQFITDMFRQDAGLDVFGAVFRFFYCIGDLFHVHISDRADPSRYIDEYVNELDFDQRKLIFAARDEVMIKLENLRPGDSLGSVFSGGFYWRKSTSEKYLFDYSVPISIDDSLMLRIDGLLVAKDGFRTYWLSDNGGRVGKDRQINFSIRQDTTRGELYKWKVKNADTCGEPRGEITDHHTAQTPERTAFVGHHYVECFAIRQGVCVARSRQSVIIE